MKTIHQFFAITAMIFIGYEFYKIIMAAFPERVFKQLKGEDKTANLRLAVYWLWMLAATLFMPRPASLIMVGFAIFAASITLVALVIFIIKGLTLLNKEEEKTGEDIKWEDWIKTASIDQLEPLIKFVSNITIFDSCFSIIFLIAALYYIYT